MKIAFDGFIYILDMEKKKISELEEMSIGIPKPEMQREKKHNTQELWDNYKECNIHTMDITRRVNIRDNNGE